MEMRVERCLCIRAYDIYTEPEVLQPSRRYTNKKSTVFMVVALNTGSTTGSCFLVSMGNIGG